ARPGRERGSRMRFIDHARAAGLAAFAAVALAAGAAVAAQTPAPAHPAASAPAAPAPAPPAPPAAPADQPAQRASTPQPGTYQAPILSLDRVRGQLTVALPAPVRGKATLALSDAASWDLLAHARPRQVVTIEVDDVNAPKVITRVDQVSAWVGWWPRVVIFAIAAIILGGVAMAVTGGRPLQLVIGKDGRYSNSQVQLALW